MRKQITSTQNKTVKRILQLQEKSRNRKKENVFIVEGIREIFLAKEAGYQFESVYCCLSLLKEETLVQFHFPDELITELSEEVYQKIAYRGSTEGIMALVKAKPHQLEDLSFKNKTPLILVAEAPEKPGNIGAILRTADAANVDAVLIANPKTDLYNPNIIRSSVGCVFTNSIATGSTSEIISYLKANHIHIYCAALQASEPYTKQDYTKATAIVVGTEANGLQQEWLDKSTQNIIIPMEGKIDSMNVSVAAGILIFEAKRQRRLN